MGVDELIIYCSCVEFASLSMWPAYVLIWCLLQPLLFDSGQVVTAQIINYLIRKQVNPLAPRVAWLTCRYLIGTYVNPVGYQPFREGREFFLVVDKRDSHVEIMIDRGLVYVGSAKMRASKGQISFDYNWWGADYRWRLDAHANNFLVKYEYKGVATFGSGQCERSYLDGFLEEADLRFSL